MSTENHTHPCAACGQPIELGIVCNKCAITRASFDPLAVGTSLPKQFCTRCGTAMEGVMCPNCDKKPTVKGISHAELVRKLLKPGHVIAAEMTSTDANLVHCVMGISGEAGELLDAVKKAVIYRRPLDRANVIEELGDIEFYMEAIRQALGISRTETVMANMWKLSRRYADGYSDQAAQARADKQEG